MSLYLYRGGGQFSAADPSGVVNVRDYGAKGDGSTNDTAAIQAAVDYAATVGIRTVIVPDGTYMIQAHDPSLSPMDSQGVVFYVPTFGGGIRLRSGLHLKLSRGATLRAIPNNHRFYRILSICEVSNVEVSGGTIQGERAAHIGTNGGEWGHGIGILAATDVHIHDVRVKDCWGDGINTNLSGSDTTRPCRRLEVERVLCDNNRRQGMSISSVVDMSVLDSTFQNTIGTAPEAGIDIESNSSSSPTTDITIARCRLSGNNGAGVSAVDGYVDRVTITDCRFEGNKCSGTYPGQIWVWVQPTRSYKITGNWFAAPGAAGVSNILLHGGKNVEVTGNVMTGAPITAEIISETRIERNTLEAVPATMAAVGLTSATENVTVGNNRITGGSVGVALTGSATANRLSVTGNKISGSAGAAVSIAAPTTNVLVRENEGWSNGSGVYFDTAKTHTTPRAINADWSDGTDTLPA